MTKSSENDLLRDKGHTGLILNNSFDGVRFPGGKPSHHGVVFGPLPIEDAVTEEDRRSLREAARAAGIGPFDKFLTSVPEGSFDPQI